MGNAMSVPVHLSGSEAVLLPPWIARQVQQLLPHRGHALLLGGPSGLGQYELALALASAWLCDQPGPEGACGRCESCHAIGVRTHADLLTLVPEELALSLGWPLDDAVRDRLEKKDAKASRWIRVEAARSVVSFAQTTRSRGNTKVVLVYPTDRLNTESANALLKTLEEPAGNLRFVLATDAAHQLLPTVRSRCQWHTMAWPGRDEALQWLGQMAPKADLNHRETALRAAGGRPADALQWLAMGLTPTVWAQWPSSAARGDISVLAGWSLAQQLGAYQQLCHDLMAVGAGAAPRFFARDQLPATNKLPGFLALHAWWHDLVMGARRAEHPFSAGLAQEAWAARAVQALRA